MEGKIKTSLYGEKVNYMGQKIGYYWDWGKLMVHLTVQELAGSRSKKKLLQGGFKARQDWSPSWSSWAEAPFYCTNFNFPFYLGLKKNDRALAAIWAVSRSLF